MFSRIDLSIRRVTAFFVILLMVAMTVSILVGVFYRYVLNSALTWPEELARYAMVWVTCLGASLALRYGEHVAVEFVVQKLPFDPHFPEPASRQRSERHYRIARLPSHRH